MPSHRAGRANAHTPPEGMREEGARLSLRARAHPPPGLTRSRLRRHRNNRVDIRRRLTVLAKHQRPHGGNLAEPVSNRCLQRGRRPPRMRRHRHRSRMQPSINTTRMVKVLSRHPVRTLSHTTALLIARTRREVGRATAVNGLHVEDPLTMHHRRAARGPHTRLPGTHHVARER